MAAPDGTSRYAGVPTVVVPTPDGTPRTMVAPRVVPAPPTRGAYVVRPGDRLDLLGLAATGDTTRWWVLADANPYADATRLETAGQTVELPDG
jgi:hypothetical protein